MSCQRVQHSSHEYSCWHAHQPRDALGRVEPLLYHLAGPLFALVSEQTCTIVADNLEKAPSRSVIVSERARG